MIEVRPESDTPIYRQIVDGVRLAIAAGRLRPGDAVPSVRALAVRLRVNPNTVARAYRELESLGVFETLRGAGSIVSANADADADLARVALVEERLLEAIGAARDAGLTRRELLEAIARLYDASKETS